MIIKNMDQVPLQDVNMEGAKDVKVRVLFGPADNAPTFAMRVFELSGGGHTPFHTHPFEHEAMLLDGDIAVVTEEGDRPLQKEEGDRPLQKGDVILVPPDEKHQFKNLSETESARFMCLVPIAYQK
ncbi:MAG: cupin domain-containing protein [Planctomycetota bacterium]|jgi:quercetin dioxygenase-like cupin family protein